MTRGRARRPGLSFSDAGGDEGARVGQPRDRLHALGVFLLAGVVRRPLEGRPPGCDTTTAYMRPLVSLRTIFRESPERCCEPASPAVAASRGVTERAQASADVKPSPPERRSRRGGTRSAP